MQLDELKKSMSTLEQVLAKTNTEIQINISASKTAQARILKKFRQGFISCLVLAAVFASAIAGNINPTSFPVYLKIYLVVYLLLGAIWYSILYTKLKHMNIAVLPSAKLFSQTATLKLMVLTGEIVFGIGIAVFFTLLFPNAWQYNRLGFWAMVVTLLIAIVYNAIHFWPRYIKLFHELNSIEE